MSSFVGTRSDLSLLSLSGEDSVPYGVCESLVCHGRRSSVNRVVVCPKPTHKGVPVCTRKHADQKASRCKSGCGACSSNQVSLHSNAVSLERQAACQVRHCDARLLVVLNFGVDGCDGSRQVVD